MKTLRLPSQFNEGQIEDLQSFALDELESILVPSNISFGLGNECAFIHWLTCWAQCRKSRKVVFEFDSENERATSRLPYLAALGLVGTEFKTLPNDIDVTKSQNKELRGWLFSQQQDMFSPAGLESGHGLFCVDSSDIPFPEQLYKIDGDAPIVRDVNHFSNVFAEFTNTDDAIVPIFQTHESGIENSDIPRVIYELFRNTHDHARTSLNGERLSYSLRGLFVKAHRGPRDSLVSDAESPLRLYLNRLGDELSLSSTSSPVIMEISVFDSGPGLAAHRANQESVDMTKASIQDERKWLYECFKKNSTGVPGDENRGLGLDEVQRALNGLKGFMYARSGRLSIFRDFLSGRFDGNVSFSDAINKTQFIRPHKSVKGSLFTVIVPCKELV